MELLKRQRNAAAAAAGGAAGGSAADAAAARAAKEQAELERVLARFEVGSGVGPACAEGRRGERGVARFSGSRWGLHVRWSATGLVGCALVPCRGGVDVLPVARFGM
jgi:hypothetical protein